MRTIILLLTLLAACMGLDEETSWQMLTSGYNRTVLVPGYTCKGADGVDKDPFDNLVVPCENHGSNLTLTPSAVVLWNNGDGTFTTQFLPGSLVGPEDAKWFDEEGDGDLDILITEANRVSLYRRNGSTFTWEILVNTGPGINNLVVPLSPGRFVLGSYSTGGTIDECVRSNGVYTCTQQSTAGWPKRGHALLDGDALIWDNRGPWRGVHRVFTKTPTGNPVQLTTNQYTQGGSVKDGRVTTGTANTETHTSISVQIIGEPAITYPVDLSDYRDSILDDVDGDGTDDLVISGCQSTTATASIGALLAPDFQTFVQISGAEEIKHDNIQGLTINGTRCYIATEEQVDSYGLGVLLYCP